ncbi:helix-turn-helix transcriptional regulator [Coprobacter tertius]|uniref:WYL domain-containing protein n=1 Tax=Coprobacter tertius TaxID=2944915 RepID=A0ABT1MG27_9BACT|nr:WYL domain-containing protein [Coprobacter tertius]MCP9611593.1 WYL domain-containing protein [Coprobacter tertius]
MNVLTRLYETLSLIDKIKNTPYLSIEELTLFINSLREDGQTYSVRQVKQKIREIKINWHISIEYSRYYKGYYLPAQENREIQRITDALYVFYALTNSPEIVFPEKHIDAQNRYLPALAKAVTNRCELQFDYHSFSKETFEIKTVEPVALKESYSHWYLLGKYPGKERLRSFSLDRIRNPKVTGRIYKQPASENIENLFADSFGMFSGKQYPAEDVILSFDSLTGKYLKNKPLHHSQTVLCDIPGQFVVQLHVRITPDFISELMSHAESLQVIHPVSLKKRITEVFAMGIVRNRF